MVPGGVTEVVWHFAGYFQIINDIARDRIGYDESAFRNLQDDYITPRISILSTATVCLVRSLDRLKNCTILESSRSSR